MGDRSHGVTDDLRRVLARLGGLPAVHTPGTPEVAVHAPEMVRGTVAPPVVDFTSNTHTHPRPSTSAIGDGIARFSASVRRRHDTPSTEARTPRLDLEAPAAHLGDPGVAAPARRVPLGAWSPDLGRLEVCATTAHAPPCLIDPWPAAGAVPPLPRISLGRHQARADGPVFALTLRRQAWDSLSRARLAVAWQRVVADHGFPGEELQLHGLFGPVPFHAVGAVALRGDGRLLVRVQPSRRVGPVGDVVLARHQPTGQLLRSDVARTD
ncbi:MAG: hypothetical protein H6531_02175 [Actinobacteria bacterium]|nr:hypothetical protein [Actinomycetota bacterium]